MLRFGSLRTNRARSAEAVPMKSHGFSVGALLFYLDLPNACESARGPDAESASQVIDLPSDGGVNLGGASTGLLSWKARTRITCLMDRSNLPAAGSVPSPALHSSERPPRPGG